MKPVKSKEMKRAPAPSEARPAPVPARRPRWLRFPGPPLVLIALFSTFTFFPPVRTNPRLVWAFVAAAAVLCAWTAILWTKTRRSGVDLLGELAPVVKSHCIQASVQLCIYAYWGYYWRNVYAEAPLILAQFVFLYAFDALLSWTRGRNWRLGFGPLPIILSTNVFIWFKDDWFIFQFLMIATGALGKEFIKWNKGGRRTHIFNPSAFTLGLFSLVLIVTGTTNYTWGVEIATTLALPPHIYLLIFMLGLIVQYFFAVTLMTLSAVAALVLCNAIYTGSFGTYPFVDTNIPVAIFLGLHLLVTDPSTSPRTNVGRVIFGGLYGLANFVLYQVFENIGVPEYYDKLLPVPILNLSIQMIDRWAGSGFLGRISRWESKFQPRKLNLAYMAGWVALFLALLSTGYVEAPHKGASIAFWKQAFAAGKPDAGQKLFKLVGSQANGSSGSACNELGLLYMEGKGVAKDHAAAAHYFAQACELGDANGCANVAAQFLFLHEAQSDADVARALDRLERDSAQGSGGRSSSLIGYAYETGNGRTLDKKRARELYERGCGGGDTDACKGLACMSLMEDSLAPTAPGRVTEAVRALERSSARGDAESCIYLGYMFHAGVGVERDESRAIDLLKRACMLGSDQACAALKQTSLPPFSAAHVMMMPTWCSDQRPLGE
jgi:TPR repeat protein